MSWVSAKDHWRVAFNWRGETRFVGCFADEAAATGAYSRAAAELCGGFDRLNDLPTRLPAMHGILH